MTGAPPVGRGRDAGFTLAETLVVLGIMSVIMVVVTGNLLGLIGFNRFITTVADAQAQVGRVFSRLDLELRYAADLRVQTVPAAGSGYPSLLYLSTGDAHCHALSLAGGELVLHRWAPGAGPAGATVLAVGVGVVDPAEAPFMVTGGSPASGGDENSSPAVPKEAVVSLSVVGGDPARPVRRELRESFIAPNSLRGPQGASLDDCLIEG